MSLSKVIGWLTVVGLLWGGVQGTILANQWLKTLYADYVESKIADLEVRRESTVDNIDDRSVRIQYYQRKEDRGISLDPDDVDRKRGLVNERERLEKRRDKIDDKIDRLEQ